MASRPDFGITKLALSGTLDFASKLLGHRLHPVADAKHRYAQFKNHLRRPPLSRFVDRIGASGEDDAFRVELANEILTDIEWMQFAIDLLFAYPPGNQLRDLRTKIEDENFLVCHFRALKE